MRTAEEIVALWRERQQAQSPIFAKMDHLRRAYNGDLVLPLPQVDKVEKAAVANLIQQGVDQLGSRVASVRPDVDCPSENPGQDKADRLARHRRMAILGWWDHSNLDILDGRRARHLLAYASSPCQIRPGHSKDKPLPTWHVRSPLQTFAGPRPNPDDMAPDDCIFTYEVTLAFLQRRYPEAVAGLEKGGDPSPDQKFEVLEYHDHDIYSMIAIGRQPAAQGGYGARSYVAGAPLAELIRVPNRAGICPVVVPKRTSLDIPIGKFEGMTGMFQAQAKLMALTLIAVERNVFPQEWLIGRPGEVPEVLREADPKNGQTGVLTGGMLQEQNLNPSMMSTQMMEMLEGNQRQQGGIPADFLGTSPTNVRTGRRGADIVSAQVDFPVQEAQTLLARSKERENTIAIAISKAYFGAKTVSFYVRKQKGGRGAQVSYRPNDIFTTDVNFVDYPHAGSDANQLAVLIGQLVGLQMISKQSARKMHPLVDDPMHEAELVQSEALTDALLGAVVAEVQQGKMDSKSVAMLIQALDEDRSDLARAVTSVHEAAQAAAAGVMTPQGGTVPAVAGPVGAPGGAAAGVPVPPAVAPPSPSEANLAQLLSTLHAPPGQMAAAS